MTNTPNFSDRITAAELELLRVIEEYLCRDRETWIVSHACGAIVTACAALRDYARQSDGEQARTALTAEAQTLGMYDVTDGHEDDPINTQGGK